MGILRTLPLLAVFGAALSGCDQGPNSDPPHPAIPSRYSPGGEYSFTGRPGDPQPRFLVLHVDSHPTLGNIIHVRLSGIAIKNPQAPQGVADRVEHLPIAEASLDNSGPKLIRTGSPLPEFIDTYMLWRKPFDQGKAGIWSKPLAECIDALELGLNGGKK
jgi:hypothetical protein